MVRALVLGEDCGSQEACLCPWNCGKETQKLRPLLNVARVRPEPGHSVGLVMGESIVLSVQVGDSKCAEGVVAGPV